MMPIDDVSENSCAGIFLKCIIDWFSRQKNRNDCSKKKIEAIIKNSKKLSKTLHFLGIER